MNEWNSVAHAQLPQSMASNLSPLFAKICLSEYIDEKFCITNVHDELSFLVHTCYEDPYVTVCSCDDH